MSGILWKLWFIKVIYNELLAHRFTKIHKLNYSICVKAATTVVDYFSSFVIFLKKLYCKTTFILKCLSYIFHFLGMVGKLVKLWETFINGPMHIRHPWKKTTVLICHRRLINTGVEKNERHLNVD